MKREVSGADVIALEWLAEMQDCVREVDFNRCRAIFVPGVVAFGTKAAALTGIDQLEHDQWRQIWGNIRGFTFITDRLHCGQFGDDGLWLACVWTSEGPAVGGGWRIRPGRMSAVLERREGRWLAVHTHHSLVPGLDLTTEQQS